MASAACARCSTSSTVRPRDFSAATFAEDLLGQHRREAHRGLVEQQQLRARHQRAADRQHLLLSARQRAGRDRRASRPAPGTSRRPRRDRARCRHRGASRRQAADCRRRRAARTPAALPAPARCRRARARAARACGSACRRNMIVAAPNRLHAGNRAQQRGLAGAVAADQRDHLARRDRRATHRAAPRCGRSRS